MKNEAIANAERDKKIKEEIDKLNAADAMVFNTDKQLKEFGDKIPADKKTAIETANNKLREAHKNKDLAAIDTLMAELNDIWQSASQEMYNAQGGSQAQGGTNPNEGNQSTPNDEAVTDVDFEEVK
jgi:molecular chaperone DnaK